MSPPRILAAVALFLAAWGCAPRVIVQREIVYLERPAGDQPPPPPALPREVLAQGRGEPPAGIAGVLQVAREHLGKIAVSVQGRAYRFDCSGFVRGMFSVKGIDLLALGDEYPGANGVRLIHHYLARFGRVHQDKRPLPGDVVFFDNTYDKNENGQLDDPYTHVGIVESLDPDGTLTLIHRVNRGIVRDVMNLYRPHDSQDEQGKRLNGWLRPKRRQDPPGTQHLLGELFSAFGTAPDRPPADAVSALARDPEPAGDPRTNPIRVPIR